MLPCGKELISVHITTAVCCCAQYMCGTVCRFIHAFKCVGIYPNQICMYWQMLLENGISDQCAVMALYTSYRACVHAPSSRSTLQISNIICIV